MKTPIDKIGRKGLHIYRIKYLPLNLYYKPTRKNNKDNLSEEGKIFFKVKNKTNLKIIHYKGEDITTKPSDWQIEKYIKRLEKTIILTTFADTDE